MFDFEDALRSVSAQTVLCVGDLMLDEFVYGEVTRISPEAPTPVLAVERSEIEIGWTFLARSHWGGLYIREMKRLMLRHAFQFVDRVIFLILLYPRVDGF